MTTEEKNLRDQYAGMAMQSMPLSVEQMDAIKILMEAEKIEFQEAVSILAFTQAEYMIEVRRKLNKAREKKENGEEK